MYIGFIYFSSIQDLCNICSLKNNLIWIWSCILFVQKKILLVQCAHSSLVECQKAWIHRGAWLIGEYIHLLSTIYSIQYIRLICTSDWNQIPGSIQATHTKEKKYEKKKHFFFLARLSITITNNSHKYLT